MGFILDFSLAKWRMEKSLPAVGDIPNNYLLRLMDETGIAGYLKEPSCNMSDGVYAGAVNGWTNGKSAESDQQDEQHGVSCHCLVYFTLHKDV